MAEAKTTTRKRGKRLTVRELATAKETFLTAFRQSANVTYSCRAANVGRTAIYDWLEKDEAFSLSYRHAELEAQDVIRLAILQRAIQGVEEPVVNAGRLVRNEDGSVLTVKKYSDSLLALLAKARLPEFRNAVDVQVSGGEKPIQHQHTHTHLDFSIYSDEELDQLETLARRLKEHDDNSRYN